ncbi:MAG: hypothetical protein JO210_15690 [Acidobacteriaceae bacterium]|nr:hypothetical protein [Acidobacteriaceae bacterium]
MALRVAAITLLASMIMVPRSVAQSNTSSQASAENPAVDAAQTPSPIACPAGAPIGAVELRVQSAANPESLAFQTINHLTEGDTVLYEPVLREHEKRPGEVSLVMVPAKREPKEAALLVTDPKAADKPQRWNVPKTVTLAALVYGPQGLSKKKVEGFLSQDDLLIAQLADYAEKTAQTEALVEALSNSGSSSASVNAALTGFASQYGMSVQLDKTAPPAVQAQTLFAAMNPQLATYNPLASSNTERVAQTASVATAAATLFFGSPIGLAAGGTAMLLDLRYIAFPGTQFRSSFAQPLVRPSTKDALSLCGQNTPAPPHTRVAFIWAVRIPNTPAPDIRIAKADFIPPGQKTPVPVEVPDPQWKYLQRSRAWALENAKGQKFPISVLKLGNQKALELDLTKASAAPGDYHLAGYWDWTRFQASGEIHVQLLSDFASAKLEPDSQDKLLAKSGKIPVTVAGSDFEFLTKVEIKKLNDEFAVAEPLRFILPKGLREGPQNHADVQIDTTNLDPGRYELLLSQQDAKSHSVNINVLPGLPKIDNLPMLANQGEATQHYILKGERLNLISKIEAPGASFDLGAPTPTGTDRSVAIQLKSDLKPGTSLPVQAGVADRNEPMTLPGALEITGPVPAIASSHLSLPTGIAVALPRNEFPAGYNLTAMLDVRNIEPTSALKLACSEGTGGPVKLHIGEQTSTYSLQQLSPDQLFVSFDTSAFPAGCQLQATIDNGKTGESRPFTLAHIVRLPQIDSFERMAQVQSDGKRSYALIGRNLEMIEKVGWDQLEGIPVPALPTPIQGQGLRQALQVNLPDPPPAHAGLFIWLRGEKTASSTNLPAPSKLSGPGAPPPTAARQANTATLVH